jgi:DNA-binding NarL/FixJ family response regulator
VLEPIAEGLSNTAIAARLFLRDGATSKYTTTIFAKLGLAEDGTPTAASARCSHTAVRKQIDEIPPGRSLTC